MRGLQTISFSEGENGMTCHVAYQQLTGIGTAHPFLHWVPAGAISLSRGLISAGVHQNQPKSAKNRSTSVRVGRISVSVSQVKSFRGSRRVREMVKTFIGESRRQYRSWRPNVLHGKCRWAEEVD
jgi:hypothetical protein